MRKVYLINTALVFCILLSSCTSVKRYKSARYKGDEQELVDMNLYVSRLDQAHAAKPAHGLWDLGANAQTELIRILNTRHPHNADFHAALNRTYTGRDLADRQQFTRFDLRMVFTISKFEDHAQLGKAGGLFSPADRIESLKFRLILPESSALSFQNWNRFATEYGEVEIAEISFNQNMEVELQASGEVLEGGAHSSSGRKEDQVLRKRYLKLNGSLGKQELEIREEGNREIDLAGNVVAEVDLVFDPFTELLCCPVYGGEEGGPARILDLEFKQVSVPRMEGKPEKIQALLQWEYIYRHVERGGRTFQEWDDKVAYYKGRSSREVTLFERSDYVPSFCALGFEREGERDWLRATDHLGREHILLFQSHDEAAAFLQSLSGQENPKPGSGGALELGSYRLTAPDGSLKIMQFY